jgi:hypothetical protein
VAQPRFHQADDPSGGDWEAGGSAAAAAADAAAAGGAGPQALPCTLYDVAAALPDIEVGDNLEGVAGDLAGLMEGAELLAEVQGVPFLQTLLEETEL